MISTAISITKYENEAALEERREEEERWMTMMMTIMIVLRKQLAHITRGRAGARGPAAARCLPFGKDSINPEKNQISGEVKETARWQGSHFLLSYLLPTTSSLASVCD